MHDTVCVDTRDTARASQNDKGEVSLPQLPRIVSILLALLIYFLLGKASLRFAMVHPSATAVWLPTGATLAAFLLLGYRIWPGVFLGAFLVNLTTAGSVATSIAIAVGNTLEGITGAYLVNRFARGSKAFDRTQDVFRFAFFAGMISTAVSATFGITSLFLGGFAKWPSYASIWLTWWLGDGVSDVVVAPLLLLWSRRSRLVWTRFRVIEALLLLPLLVVVGRVVFGGLLPFRSSRYPLEFLCIPLLVWAAFRLGEREAALATLIISGIAIWGTLNGLGPFAIGMRNDSLLLLDLFLAVLAVTGLALAAATKERNRAAETFERVVESAPNAIVAVDQQGKIVLANSQAEELFGYHGKELVGRSVELLVPERFRSGHPGSRAGFAATPQARPMGAGRDLYAVRKDGTEFPVEIGLNPVETAHGMLVLGSIMDITERKRTEEQIRQLALTDPLTGLANYRRLLDALDSEIKRYGRTTRSFAVVLIDLDGLKKINDAHGHLVGSRALIRVANILRSHCREIDTAARYGGDEFVVVLPETESEAALHVTQRISTRLRNDSEEPSLSVSAGVAIFPHDGPTITELLAAADRALYREKRAPEVRRIQNGG
jgi:diguanylate cyclase (GGDEF)-like protein/PAS domain S-box-containing protein